MKNGHLEILLSREQISERIRNLAETISSDYRDKEPLLLCVLKGAVIFLADLIRNLRLRTELDFITASSYEKDKSTGKIRLSPVCSAVIRGKDILIVEDIVDTGLTCRTLIEYLTAHEPQSLKLCTLLDKPSQRRSELIRLDYVGFTIPDRFVVGYGLDYEGKYRELKDICVFLP